MKATLEFSLPEEERELLLATRAHKLLAALEEARQSLRLHLKHGDATGDRRVLDELRSHLYDCLLEFEE